MNAPLTRSEFIFVHMTELQLGRQEARRVDRNSLSLNFGALRVLRDPLQRWECYH